MKSKLNNKLLLSLALIFLIFTITIYKCLLGFDYNIFFTPGDPLSWKKLAIKLYELNIFAEGFPENDPFRSWRTPGYPFYLSLLMHLGIFNIYFIFLMNIFFLLLSLLFIFLIGKKFLKNSQTIFFIILYCLTTHINTISEIVQQNLNESLYFFLLSLSVYFILNKNNYISSLGYLILGLSVLVRTTALPLIFFLLILLVIYCLFKKKNLIKIKYFLVLVPAIFWMLRNSTIFGEFGYFIGSNSDHLLLGTFKFVDWQFIDNLYNNLNTENRTFEVVRSEMRMKLALSRIIDNPIQYFLFRVDVILRHLYDHYAILPLAMLTFIFFKKKKDKNLFQKNKLILFLIFISIVFLLIHSITIYNPRYGVISSFYLSYFLWILILKVFLEKNVYS